MTQHTGSHSHAPFWHMDCLGTVTILALGFSRRQQRRLAERFGFSGERDQLDAARVLQNLHEACHHHQPLTVAIAGELGARFAKTCKEVRSATLEGLDALETDFPLPFFWATLIDPREEVRAHGRRRLHAFLLTVLKNGPVAEQRVNDLEGRLQELGVMNQALLARIRSLEADIQNMRHRFVAAIVHWGIRRLRFWEVLRKRSRHSVVW